VSSPDAGAYRGGAHRGPGPSASGLAVGSQVNSFVAGISQPINSWFAESNGDLGATRLAFVCGGAASGSVVRVSGEAPNGNSVAASGNAPC